MPTRRWEVGRSATFLAPVAVAAIVLVACGSSSTTDDQEAGVERPDLTLAEARVETMAEVDAVAARLGRVVVPDEGKDLSCADLPDDGDPVYFSYGLGVDASTDDVGTEIDDLAEAYESKGWSRIRTADGPAVRLDRGGYRLQIEPGEVRRRIVVTGISPCVKDPDV